MFQGLQNTRFNDISPTDRHALNIENILRDEVRQWVVPAGQENDGWDDFEESESVVE